MNKEIILLGVLTLAFLCSVPTSEAANTLDVEFRGELISTACVISDESVKKEVTINNLRWQFINENGASAVTPFSIAIHKCSETDLQKSIKLTWQSNQLVDIAGNLFLTTQGDSNVVLNVVDSDEKPVIWNKPMPVGIVSVIDNIQQLDFGVAVHKPATGDAKVGSFTGTVTFMVEYE